MSKCFLSDAYYLLAHIHHLRFCLIVSWNNLLILATKFIYHRLKSSQNNNSAEICSNYM